MEAVFAWLNSTDRSFKNTIWIFIGMFLIPFIIWRINPKWSYKAVLGIYTVVIFVLFFVFAIGHAISVSRAEGWLAEGIFRIILFLAAIFFLFIYPAIKK